MSINKHIKETAIKNNDLYRSEPKFPKQKLRLTLPLPLSVNHMYYNTRYGGKRLKKEAEDYIRTATSITLAAMEDEMWKMQKDATWYYMDLLFYMPDRKTRDNHNMLKLLLDTLEGCAYHNDYYVMPNILGVEYDKENPRVEVILRPQTEKDREKAIKMFS